MSVERFFLNDRLRRSLGPEVLVPQYDRPLDEIFQRALENYDFLFDSNYVRGEIGSTRENIGNVFKTNPRTLARIFVNKELFEHFSEAADEANEQERHKDFFLWQDLAWGVVSLTGQLEQTEKILDGRLNDIANDYSPIETLSEPLKDIHERILVLLVDKSRRGAELIERKQNGFLLVNEFIKSVKGEENEFSDTLNRIDIGHIPEFVWGGAEFAAKSYKFVVPIAEEFASYRKYSS